MKNWLIYIKALLIALCLVIGIVFFSLIFIPVAIILFILGAFQFDRIISWHRSTNSTETSSDINVSNGEYTILSAGNKLTHHPSSDPKTIIIEGEKSDPEK